jgi:membrane-associated phospholipid phosphatase
MHAMKEIFYDWGGANVWLFHAINSVHGDSLDRAMRLGTTLGDHGHFALYFALASLVGLLTVSRASVRNADTSLPMAQLWLTVLTVFSVAYLLDGALLGWLKPMLDFPRPPLALPPGSVHLVGEPEFHHSLPSGHSAFAMLVTASLWPALNRWGKLAGAGFVLWVGLSRISLGVHFPADVVAGFLSSYLVVVLVRWNIRMLTQLAAR